MFLNLNLLSEQKKATTEQVVGFVFIKNILEMCVFIVTIIAIALTLSWLTLEEEFSNLSTSSLLVNKGYSSYSQEIRKLNQKTFDISIAGKNYTQSYPKFIEMISLLPSEILINRMEIDYPEKTAAISGIAKTRDSLLNFIETLENVDWINTVSTPPSQLFKKENINFEILCKLKI